MAEVLPAAWEAWSRSLGRMAPNGTPTTLRYVVASTPRSGSTLLCSLLLDHGLGNPLEYLLDHEIATWAKAAAGRNHLEAVRAARTSPNGCFGQKVMWRYCPRLVALESPEALLATRFVLLTRRDLLAQATSWARAEATNAWTSQTEPMRPAVYDAKRIATLLEEAALQNARWRAWTTALGVETLEVVYEDVVQDAARELVRIARFLGVELVPGVASAQSFRPERQQVPPGERWDARFVADSREALLAKRRPRRWWRR